MSAYLHSVGKADKHVGQQVVYLVRSGGSDVSSTGIVSINIHKNIMDSLLGRIVDVPNITDEATDDA